MVNFPALVRKKWMALILPLSFALGYYLDSRADNQLTQFRNKSMLFSRELKPGEEVTWK